MLKRGDEVLLVGISHPNEVLFTFSRVVEIEFDDWNDFIPYALNYMKSEAYLDWDDASLDEMLIITQDLDCRQINPYDWE